MKLLKLSILLCFIITAQAKEIIRLLDNSHCFFKYDDKNPYQGSVACADNFEPAAVVCGGNKPQNLKVNGSFANPAFVINESGADDLCYVYQPQNQNQLLTKTSLKHE